MKHIELADLLGGAWRRTAMRDIADYLGVEFSGCENFIVIS